MTDEELQKTIEEISREIERLSAPKEPLSRAERRRQSLLMMKKSTLEKVQRARAKNNPQEEMRHYATYGILCSFGEKHPLLLRLMRSKVRWNTF